jgi:hypothetical protein
MATGTHAARGGTHGHGGGGHGNGGRARPRDTYASAHHWGRERGARAALRRRVYMSCFPHLKLPSLLLLVSYLAPAKYFAWDLGG